MIFENFFAKLAGKTLAAKMNLEDGKMDETKPWYKSKTIWSDVVTIVLSVVGFVDAYFTHGKITQSPFYNLTLTVLGGMGIYTRANATTKIG